MHINLGPGNLQIRGGDQVEPCNFTWLKFRLDRSSGANPEIVVLEHSPCEYPQCGYGGNP